MNIDLSAAWRRLNEHVAPWLKGAVLAAPFVGEGVRNGLILFKVPLEIEKVGYWAWPTWGLIITVPIAMIWRWLKPPPKELITAELYIQTLVHGMKLADYSPQDAKFIWRSIFQKIAQDFKVGRTPPDPKKVLEEVKRETPDAII